MIVGFGDDQSLSGSVNSGVSGVKPGESKNDVFVTKAHDIEEVFLGDPFDVHIKGACIAAHTGFVHSLVYVVNCDGGGEFFCGKVVFPDKLLVNARDICTRVY